MQAKTKKRLKYAGIGLAAAGVAYLLYEKAMDKKYPNRSQTKLDYKWDLTNALRAVKGMEPIQPSWNKNPTVNTTLAQKDIIVPEDQVL